MRQVLMRFCLMIAALVPTLDLVLAASSEGGRQFEFHSQIEESLTNLVRRYDPEAWVSVDLRYRRLEGRLPGVGLGGESQTVQTSEIESILVRVLLREAVLPPSLEQMIRNRVAIQGVKVRILSEPLAPELREQIAANHSSKPQWREALEELNLRIQQKFSAKNILILLVGLFTFGSALGCLIVLVNSLFQRRLFTSLFDHLPKSTGAEASLDPQVISRSQSSSLPDNPAGEATSYEDIKQLDVAALLSLMSDSYWCEEDAYASWIWSHLGSAQRKELLALWPLDGVYFEHIQSLPPREIEGLHRHPSYLRDSPWVRVSNSDLQKFLREHPSAWTFVSPLRARHLKLELTERLACLKAKISGVVPAVQPSSPAQFRQIVGAAKGAPLSFAEESKILRDPDLVPKDLKSSILSLVWLALAPIEERQKILSRYTAQDLALAWHASEEVIGKLEEALPEKKRDLLRSYLSRSEPSPDTEVWKELVEKGIRLNESHGELREDRVA